MNIKSIHADAILPQLQDERRQSAGAGPRTYEGLQSALSSGWPWASG